jgi:hypothetical protein
VSAWVKLARDDRTATVAAQDGTRMSGFVLQYRPDSKRWVFGTHGQDNDLSPLVYAQSTDQALVNDWTHLSGVYDHPTGQLRLYVDGKLSGTRDNVRMWTADGSFSIGRALSANQHADKFIGWIDEVRIDQRVLTDERLLERGTHPKPAPGQIGRYNNNRGDHYTGSTDQPVREGYRYEGTLGMPVPAGENTRMLFACKDGNDTFTSAQADCEGKAKLGEVGRVYSVKPTNVATVAIYRCLFGTDRFESMQDTCEGQTKQTLLGYSLAYAPLARYYQPENPWDHWSTPNAVDPGYHYEGVLGYVAITAEPGTQPIYGCKNRYDAFTSLDSACEGNGTTGRANGRIWTAPPADGRVAHELLRCKSDYPNYLDTTNPACDHIPFDERLGYLLSSVPAVTPTF